MKPLRHAVLSTPIVTAAFAATLGVMFATASWAGPPACAGSCTPRTALVVPARAAHTDASARHVASSHLARARHHHRHALRVSRSFAPVAARPQPLSPARQRPEHRAALPRMNASTRTHSGPRDGQRALAALPRMPSMLTLAGGWFDPDRIQCILCQGGLVHSGRGPPRAGPFTSLPPSRAGGLPPFLLSTASFALLQSGSSDASRSRGVYRGVSMRIAAVSSYRLTRSLEPLQRCSCANRPEGAVACSLMPSVGGFS